MAEYDPQRHMSKALTSAQIVKLREDVASAVSGEWLDDFIARTGKKLLGKVAAQDKSTTKWLLEQVVRTCYQAKTYKNREKEQREKNSKALKKANRQIGAAKRLIYFIDEFPDIANLAWADTLLGWKGQSNGKAQLPYIEGEKVAYNEIFKGILSQYIKTMEQGIPGVQHGGALHRYQSGPLVYPKPLDEQSSQPNAERTGLLFNLVVLFQLACNGSDFILDDGMPMPDYGKPRCDLANEIVFAVLGKSVRYPKDTIKELVSKGVTLGPWPTS